MPEVIGHYHVLDRLGAGGIGELYRARDERLGRTVAVRVVSEELAADPDRRAGLIEAARKAASLSHPNIAAVYEVGEEDGRPFLALEFVPGEPLTRLIDGRAMSPRRSIGYLIQLADALAEAHAVGIEHGYLTTSNIVVTPKGVTKILDVGIAGWTRAARSLEPVADLHALGAVLLELLTGIRRSTSALATSSEALPVEDAEIGRILRKLGVTDGQGGYASAASVAADLRAVAERLDLPRADASDRPPGAPLPRWLLIVLALLVIALIVSVAIRLL